MLEGLVDKNGLIWSVEKFENHDMNSAEGLAEDHGWRLPTALEWESCPIKDTDIYWAADPYEYNPEQKSMLANFSRGRLEIAYTSRTNPQSVRLVK